jgi:hypothetical protein
LLSGKLVYSGNYNKVRVNYSLHQVNEKVELSSLRLVRLDDVTLESKNLFLIEQLDILHYLFPIELLFLWKELMFENLRNDIRCLENLINSDWLPIRDLVPVVERM